MEVNQLDLRESGSWATKKTTITAMFKFLDYPDDYGDDVKYKDAKALYKLCGSNIALILASWKKVPGESPVLPACSTTRPR